MNLIKPVTVLAPLGGVDAREIVFRLDPIWLTGMYKNVSTTGENADFKTCEQRFYRVIVTQFDQTCHSVSNLWDVNARETVFRLDPIWPPGMHKMSPQRVKMQILRPVNKVFTR